MKNRNKNTGQFQKTGKMIKCFLCHKSIYRTMFRIKRSKHQFCSRFCESKYRVGKLAPNYKGGLIFKICPTCKTIFKVRPYKKNKVCYCSRKCIHYIHGKGYKKYSSAFVSKREYIRERDKFECQNCNMTEEEHLIVMGQVLHIHHVDYDKKNCKESNLLTLCFWCNIRANTNRNYWQQYYKNKTKEINQCKL